MTFKSIRLIPILFVLLLAGSLQAAPLTPCASNPRYFCRYGAPVLLTGSHVWWNLYDRATPYDFTAYLNLLQAKNHNFIRMWAWETTTTSCCGDSAVNTVGPEFPWLRTGPGNALDGLPKFDLTQANPAFYQRLRDRVATADAIGIYVSVMLFEGVMLHHDSRAPWASHPFNPANNVNGIDGGRLAIHTLVNPAVTAVQVAYVRKVVDTVNDLDNVLYEIANESAATVNDTYWQNALISEIKTYEGTLPKQHPVGMTWQYAAEKSSGNAALWASLADFIGPGCPACWGGNGDNYRDNPPAAMGAKVVFSDTDHIWGIGGGGGVWVWKSFLRGLNPIFMDDGAKTFPTTTDSLRESTRDAMGHVRSYNADLLNQIPQNGLASSGYCLCSAEKYATLSFVSGKGNKSKSSVTVTMQPGTYSAFWVNPNTGATTSDGTFNHSGGARSFTAPIKTTMVLLLTQ